ncbi:Nuclear transport factor 2 [Smittium culicis]|uniref:Nuclear transport factor 2 n=1 Tax=Smittium culicis TaxID=133412 RepID=A0A1R1Y6T6_9FUNG|nr:Nuclear transport factor 2 [Smittium culicis]OMJ18273.1 Nuclear transport factor 2 [Smittium culicis]OMJ22618.1 Nuclear transport factor 2 [Smittium culicis]
MEEVAKQFVQFYYASFDSNRSSLTALYRDSSMLSFEGQQFLGAPSITEKLVSLPFAKVKHEVTTYDVQPANASNTTLAVLVTGQLLIDDESIPHKFSQLFNLSNENGNWFVQNDIFRLNYA